MYIDRDSRNDDFYCPATEKQLDFMRRNNLYFHPSISRREAHSKIGRYIDKVRQRYPTENQVQCLKLNKKWRNGMKRGEAYDAIREIKKSQQMS